MKTKNAIKSYAYAFNIRIVHTLSGSDHKRSKMLPSGSEGLSIYVTKEIDERLRIYIYICISFLHKMIDINKSKY